MQLSKKIVLLEQEIKINISSRKHVDVDYNLNQEIKDSVIQLIRYTQKAINLKNFRSSLTYDDLVEKQQKWISFLDFYNLVIGEIEIPVIHDGPKKNPLYSIEKNNARSQKPFTFKGIVTRNSSAKTIKVEVVRKVAHPKYKKYKKRHKIYTVHDEMEICSVGDVIFFIPTRAFSKTKHHAVLKKII